MAATARGGMSWSHPLRQPFPSRCRHHAWEQAPLFLGQPPMRNRRDPQKTKTKPPKTTCPLRLGVCWCWHFCFCCHAVMNRNQPRGQPRAPSSLWEMRPLGSSQDHRQYRSGSAPFVRKTSALVAARLEMRCHGVMLPLILNMMVAIVPDGHTRHHPPHPHHRGCDGGGAGGGGTRRHSHSPCGFSAQPSPHHRTHSLDHYRSRGGWRRTG